MNKQTRKEREKDERKDKNYCYLLLLLLTKLLTNPLVKQVWLADNSAGGGSIVQLYNWYKHLSKEGQKFDYLVNGAKSWLIVKSRELAEETKRVFGEELNSLRCPMVTYKKCLKY